MYKPTWSLTQIENNLLRNGEFWSGNTITFSFAKTLPVEYSGTGIRFAQFNSAQKTAAREAMKLWDDVIRPSLVETTNSNSDIEFFNSKDIGIAGAFLPNTVVEGRDVGGDVLFNHKYADLNDSRKPGTYGFHAFVHEIGHALGLEHPGEYNAVGGQTFNYNNHAEYRQDSLQYTAMSYFGAFETGADHFDHRGNYRYAAAPLLHDIAAIQEVYGADYSTRRGDDVYGFNSTIADRDAFNFRKNSFPVIAIWDGAGNDTLDFSLYTQNTIINLEQGAFSSTAYMKNNVAIAYGTVIENAIGGTVHDKIDGNSVANVLDGRNGNDTINGHAGNDTLLGGLGRDRLSGGTGNDRVLGEDDGDTIFGDAGADFLDGGDDRDTLWGGDGNDTLLGGTGDDTLNGNTDHDTLFGGAGNDTLEGSTGDDTLHGEAGDDTISGSAGEDTAVFQGNAADYEIKREYTGNFKVTDLNLADGNEGTDTVSDSVEWLQFDDQRISTSGYEIPAAPDLVIQGTSASEALSGNAGNDTISGGAGYDRIYGLDGNDKLYGDSFSDTLNGGNGDDSLTGGQGWDSLIGGDGIDTAVFEAKRVDYWITQENGYVSVKYQGRESQLYGGTDRVNNDVERFEFADGTWSFGNLPENQVVGHVITANRQGSILYGGVGGDSLLGNKGNDQLYGDDGDDFLNGGKGNDRAEGGLGNDLVFGGKGSDRVYGNEGDDFVDGGKQNDLVFGGEGDDTLLGGKGDDKVFGDGGNDLIYAGKGDDSASGGLGDDRIIDGKGKDFLQGGRGDDFLDGGKHNDRLYGDEGNDTLFGGKHNDLLYGGDGDDTIDGGKHNDRIFGGDGDDTMYGGSGKDLVYGGAGNDLYIIDGKDKIFEVENEGIDTVQAGFSYGLGANFENLVLTGGANTTGIGNDLNNYLWGNGGHNRLFGGAGEDTLNGYLGNDLLSGGEDADTFLFTFAEDEGQDTIVDFDRTEDILAFDDIVGGGNSLADIAAHLTIENEGDGGDVILRFDNPDNPGNDDFSGTSVRLSGLGTGAADDPLTLSDLVDDAATQIVSAPSVGLIGFITEEQTGNELNDNFHIP